MGEQMELIVISLNHKTAPVEIREKFAIAEHELVDAMQALKSQPSVLENVIVSTCNRTEIYAVVDRGRRGEDYIKRFLATWCHIRLEDLSPYLVVYNGKDMINHLFKVVCGLDSIVIGETQILGQVRNSFLIAMEANTTGTIFNTLFKQVVTFGKKVHTETNIGKNAISVSYAGVQLLKQEMKLLDNSHAVVIGAGKMAELAVQHLRSNGCSDITILNRTVEKAKVLAKKYDCHVSVMNKLSEEMAIADIVISSTSANGYVVTADMLQQRSTQLYLLDIAVPRDIDPMIRELEYVTLYDVDDLEGVIESNLEERLVESEKIKVMIKQEIIDFKEWINTLEVIPLIASLRDKSMTIHAETMASIERKLPSLSDRELKVINKLTKSIVNQMLKDPILKAKEIANEDNSELKIQIFKEIFQLEVVKSDEKVR